MRWGMPRYALSAVCRLMMFCPLWTRLMIHSPFWFSCASTLSLWKQMLGLSRPLLNVYPLDLGAGEAQQATIGLVVMMPATLKIIFGFLSDNFPILGYRRKPYMLIGWLMVSTIMILLHQSSDLSMEYDVTSGSAQPPPGAPSVELLSLAFFGFGVGMWMWVRTFLLEYCTTLLGSHTHLLPSHRADVMGDSIMVRFIRFDLPVWDFWKPMSHVLVHCIFSLLPPETGRKSTTGAGRKKRGNAIDLLCESLLWNHDCCSRVNILVLGIWARPHRLFAGMCTASNPSLALPVLWKPNWSRSIHKTTIRSGIRFAVGLSGSPLALFFSIIYDRFRIPLGDNI